MHITRRIHKTLVPLQNIMRSAFLEPQLWHNWAVTNIWLNSKQLQLTATKIAEQTDIK